MFGVFLPVNDLPGLYKKQDHQLFVPLTIVDGEDSTMWHQTDVLWYVISCSEAPHPSLPLPHPPHAYYTDDIDTSEDATYYSCPSISRLQSAGSAPHHMHAGTKNDWLVDKLLLDTQICTKSFYSSCRISIWKCCGAKVTRVWTLWMRYTCRGSIVIVNNKYLVASLSSCSSAQVYTWNYMCVCACKT